MNREEKSHSIPIDLIIEILSRLPAKSVGRFRCLSKQWGSILHCPHFTELLLTRSQARPRILFVIENSHGDEWRLFSSPQPQNPHEKSSLVVSADFHTRFYGHNTRKYGRFSLCYASGFLYFSAMWISEEAVICNPITGQYAILPKHYRKLYSFLVFDPMGKQFKVLSMGSNDHHRILTLGTEKMMWTEIHCPLAHHALSGEICINGVLYYLSKTSDEDNEASLVMVCFDVRSEEFKFIGAKYFSDQPTTKLINYKGKLGGIRLSYAIVGGRRISQLHMILLEDAATEEWSTHVYTLPKNKIFDHCVVSVAGMTATGEIIFSTVHYKGKIPFYVFYLNLEKMSLQSVEIQGFGAYGTYGTVYAFVDHVEDISANNAKILKSVISAESVKKNAKPTVLLQNKYDLLDDLE